MCKSASRLGGNGDSAVMNSFLIGFLLSCFEKLADSLRTHSALEVSVLGQKFVLHSCLTKRSKIVQPLLTLRGDQSDGTQKASTPTILLYKTKQTVDMVLGAHISYSILPSWGILSYQVVSFLSSSRGVCEIGQLLSIYK